MVKKIFLTILLFLGSSIAFANGPMLLSLENYRSDLIWKLARQSDPIKTDLSQILIVRGDINGDLAVDLADAILCLKIAAGIKVPTAVNDGADVDGDGRFGLTDALYIMQVISDRRSPPQIYDCFEDLDCGLGEFCMKPMGDCNGYGNCFEMPNLCFDIYTPVCGCDGRTYSNYCYAAREGVNIAHVGECLPP